MAAGVAGARQGILNVAQQNNDETANERQERFLNDFGLRNGLGQLVQANVRWEGCWPTGLRDRLIILASTS